MKATGHSLRVAACVLTTLCATAATQAQAWRDAGLASFDAVWARIAQTYPDPTFGGLDWEAVGRELRPRAESAASPDEQRAALRDMLARLGRSHFALLTANADEGPRGPATVPFDVRVTDHRVLVTRTFADESTVRAGDEILQVDGVDVPLVGAAAPDGEALSRLQVWRLVTRELSGAPSSTVELVVRSPGASARTVRVQRVVLPGEDVRVGNLPPIRAHLETLERRTVSGGRVGVIRFNVWMASVAESFARAVDRFRDYDGIVIDLRGNPGGLADMIRGVAGHLTDEPVLLGRMQMRNATLEFRTNPRRSTTDGRTVRPYGGPVAVLIDELTASASECFAGGLQAVGRARIFGVTSAGQALPAVTERLPNGDVLMYAVGDFVTSKGQQLEGVGVVPDETVEVTAAALAAGRDAEAAAIAWIDSARQ